jgi:hypothetical protein
VATLHAEWTSRATCGIAQQALNGTHPPKHARHATQQRAKNALITLSSFAHKELCGDRIGRQQRHQYAVKNATIPTSVYMTSLRIPFLWKIDGATCKTLISLKLTLLAISFSHRENHSITISNA